MKALLFVALLTTTFHHLTAQVGINTTQPAGPFHVYSDGTLTPGGLIILGDTSSNFMRMDYNRLQTIFFDGVFENWTDLLLQPNGGQVGINTPTPEAPFHVYSSGDVNLLNGLGLFGNLSQGHLIMDFNILQSKFGANPLDLRVQPEGGDVGINTYSPQAPLHVFSEGDVNLLGGLALLGNTVKGHLQLDYDIIQSKFDDDPFRLRIQPEGGNVGIHTYSPDAALHVYSSGNSDTPGGLGVFGNTQNGHLEIDYYSIQAFDDNQANTLVLQSNGGNLNIDNQTLYVDGSSNKVGLGTSAPSAQLHIRGLDSSSGTSALEIRNSNNQLALYVNNFQEVGIAGINNPQADLHVGGTIRADGTITSFQSISGSTVYGDDFYVADDIRHENDPNTRIFFAGDEIGIAPGSQDMLVANANTNQLLIGDFAVFDTFEDRLGIGTTTPNADLHIRTFNCIECGLILENSNFQDWRLNVNANGELELWYQGGKVGEFQTDGDYVMVSDRKFKQNVIGIMDVLPSVLQLTPSQYEFITPDGVLTNQMGFIAQDVADVFPQLVLFDREQDLHMMNYSGMQVIAIKAIQELEQENRYLEQRIEDLEQRLASIESR